MSETNDVSQNDLEEQGFHNTDDDIESEQEIVDALKTQLEREKEKVSSYETKIQYLLADFENLKKRSEADVQTRVNSITDKIILKFLGIYDDFIRAKDVLSKQDIKTEGIDAILKNMNTFLDEFDVKSIEAVGEIFDPRFHEAISVKKDLTLDDNTIITEFRKGYILKDRVIRPSLVEISKRTIGD